MSTNAVLFRPVYGKSFLFWRGNISNGEINKFCSVHMEKSYSGYREKFSAVTKETTKVFPLSEKVLVMLCSYSNDNKHAIILY
jgi:hypothetical protein